MDEEDDVIGWVLLCGSEGELYFRGKSTWRHEGEKHYALKGRPPARYAQHARRYPTREVAERALASIIDALGGTGRAAERVVTEATGPRRALYPEGTFRVHPLRRSEVALVELAACE